MCSKGGETKDLRIIASISWGCVGVGNGGISQSSSQSNGIYVQHSGLQQGNKCFSPLQSHVLIPSAPIRSASLSACHLCIFNICVFILPSLALYNFWHFLFNAFSRSVLFVGNQLKKKKGSSVTT